MSLLLVVVGRARSPSGGGVGAAMLHRLASRLAGCFARGVGLAFRSRPCRVASVARTVARSRLVAVASARAGSPTRARGRRGRGRMSQAPTPRARDALTASTSARGRPTTRAGRGRPRRVASPIVRGASSPGRSLGRRGIRGRSRQRSVRGALARWDGASTEDSWRTEGRRDRARQVQTSQRARHAPATRDRRRRRETVGGATDRERRPRRRARRAIFSRGRLVVRRKRRHVDRRARDGARVLRARARRRRLRRRRKVRRTIGGTRNQERRAPRFTATIGGGFGFSARAREYFYTPRDRPSGANRSTGTRVPVSAFVTCPDRSALGIAPGAAPRTETLLKLAPRAAAKRWAPGRARLGGR